MPYVCIYFDFLFAGAVLASYTRGEPCGTLPPCFKVEEMEYLWLCPLLTALALVSHVNANERQDRFIPTGEHTCMRMT